MPQCYCCQRFRTVACFIEYCCQRFIGSACVSLSAFFFVLQNRRYLGSRCCEYETVGASHGLAPFTQPFVSFKSVTHLHTLESLGQALPHDAGERRKTECFLSDMRGAGERGEAEYMDGGAAASSMSMVGAAARRTGDGAFGILVCGCGA